MPPLRASPTFAHYSELKTQAGWPKGVAGLHGLRHKFGSTLAHSGSVGLKDLAHVMGHADEAFTLRVYVTRRDAAPATAHLFAQRRGSGRRSTP